MSLIVQKLKFSVNWEHAGIEVLLKWPAPVRVWNMRSVFYSSNKKAHHLGASFGQKEKFVPYPFRLFVPLKLGDTLRRALGWSKWAWRENHPACRKQRWPWRQAQRIWDRGSDRKAARDQGPQPLLLCWILSDPQVLRSRGPSYNAL